MLTLNIYNFLYKIHKFKNKKYLYHNYDYKCKNIRIMKINNECIYLF